MEKFETGFEGLLLLKPRVFEDDRGYFFESFNEKTFTDLVGKDYRFVQDNQSKSQKNVLRGMHFQIPPYEQGKLIRVTTGAVLDVTIDLRKSSKTYGKHYAVEISAQNKMMLWIPPGFAHGFLTLENDTIFNYKCTNVYNQPSERSLLWNDLEFNIDWNMENPIVSEKDKEADKFNVFQSSFE